MKRKFLSTPIKINTKLAEEFNEFSSYYNGDATCAKQFSGVEGIPTLDTDQGNNFTFDLKTVLTKEDEFLANDYKSDITMIIDNLFISGEAAAENEELLVSHQITHLINLVTNEESK